MADDRVEIVHSMGGAKGAIKYFDVPATGLCHINFCINVEHCADPAIAAGRRKAPGPRVAIVMISSDMEEVIGVSDRVAVMHEGSVSGVLERDQFSEYNVLRLAVGQALETLETAAP